jgi:hypothetical protein
MRRRTRFAGWIAAGIFAGLAVALHPSHARPATPLLLLGPVAPLAAEIQWLRFHAATQRGEMPRALGLAEGALALDPSSTAGWERLAAHLLFDRASRERTPDLAPRRAAFQAGVAVVAHGVECAQDPAALELFLGLALVSKAELDPELRPGGSRELLAEAAAALERASALGSERAAAIAPQVRARATEGR